MLESISFEELMPCDALEDLKSDESLELDLVYTNDFAKTVNLERAKRLTKFFAALKVRQICFKTH